MAGLGQSRCPEAGDLPGHVPRSAEILFKLSGAVAADKVALANALDVKPARR